MKYYVYQIEKGTLNETLTIEVDVSFNSNDFDDWPDYDPVESFKATMYEAAAVAVIIILGGVFSGEVAVGGAAAAIVALLTRFLTTGA